MSDKVQTLTVRFASDEFPLLCSPTVTNSTSRTLDVFLKRRLAKGPSDAKVERFFAKTPSLLIATRLHAKFNPMRLEVKSDLRCMLTLVIEKLVQVKWRRCVR